MTDMPSPKDERDLPPQLKALARRLAEALREAREAQPKTDDDAPLARHIVPALIVS
jgi:hypothetical protein